MFRASSWEVLTPAYTPGPSPLVVRGQLRELRPEPIEIELEARTARHVDAIARGRRGAAFQSGTTTGKNSG